MNQPPHIASIDPRIIGFWKVVDEYPLTIEFRADGTCVQYLEDGPGRPLPCPPSPFRTEDGQIIASLNEPDGSRIEVKTPYIVSDTSLTIIYSRERRLVRTQDIVLTTEDNIRIRANEARIRAIDNIFDRLTSGCSEEEFMTLRCPVCGGGLKLSVHPKLDGFCVRCPAHTTHLRREGEINHVPAAWWHSRVSDDWYGDI